jgi:hypothetical protein
MRRVKVAVLGLALLLSYAPTDVLGGPSASKELRKREALLRILDDARKTALTAINDAATYRDEDHGRSGQQGVNERVQKVRDAYSALLPLLERDVAQVLKAPAAKRKAFLETDPKTLSIWEAAILGRLQDLDVLKQNEAPGRPNVGVVPTEVEREQVRVTNDYRLLLGLSALALDPRLVASARGHSAEMTKLRYFAHESPVAENRNPHDRIEKAGVKDTATGENISKGYNSAKEAFDGWYNSAGHHRNMVGTDWRSMGAGKDADHWTQNFAGAPVK